MPIGEKKEVLSISYLLNPGGTPFGGTGGPPEALVSGGHICPPPAWPNIIQCLIMPANLK